MDNIGWEMRLETEAPLIIGHRGSPDAAPENTRAGFDAAWDAGANAIELDVRWSGDGVPVVVHDANLERLSGNPIKVEQTDWAELSEVRIDGQPLMRLEEVLESYADGRLINIELKESLAPHAKPFLETLRSHPYCRESLLLSSFHPENLKLLFRAAPDIPRAFLFDVPLEDSILEFGEATDCLCLNGARQHADRNTVDRIHAVGFPYLLYTVNEPEDLRNAVDWNIDGLFTDFPGKTKEILRAACA